MSDPYPRLMSWLIGAIVVVCVAAGMYAVHRGLTAADRRGWVYYRNPKRPSPRPMGFIEEIYQPAAAHAIEQETVEESIADDDVSGDPDEPGDRSSTTRL